MSLLSNEQVENLWETMCEADNWIKVKSVLKNWNEKQPSKQFEPDWSTAPDYAVMAAINISWLTESGSWTLGYRLATYDRPPVTPHPHAEIMAKFAEVAARRVDPWVEFEYKHKANKNWLSFLANPNFNVDYNYRHIGDNK
jgi:hypothetical protein